MNIADILIHVHPDLSAQQRTRIENAIRGHRGVVSAHFGSGQPHELVVAYDPQATDSARILELVRQWDGVATMVGL